MTVPLAAPPSSAGEGKRRDGFLDTVRTIAVARVIVWHAFGLPLISWIVATMPTMFFIAGSLLAGSLDRRSVRSVYRARLKRLLVPFWFLGAVSITVTNLVYLNDPSSHTYVPLRHYLAWVLPIVDPSLSDWEAGWISTPMWYLRCYLWLLLASPMLRAAVRRWQTLALVPPLILTIGLEAVMRLGDPNGVASSEWLWLFSDFCMYGFFLMLGFCEYDGVLDLLRPAALVEWMLIGVVGAVVWLSLFPVKSGIINHTHTGLLLIGIAWLAGFLLLRPWLARVPSTDLAGPVVHWFTRRAMTIYLWHSVCIVGGYWIKGQVAPDADGVWVLLPTAAFLVVAVALTGWVEDLTVGRSAELWPSATKPWYWSSRDPADAAAPSSRLPTLSAGVAIGVCVAVSLVSLMVVEEDGRVGADSEVAASSEGGEGGLALPPTPSGRPGDLAFTAADSTIGTANEETTETASGQAAPSAVVTVLDEWLAEHDVSGARAAVFRSDGTMETAVAGLAADGSALEVDDVIPITSATKTMTAAIVLDLVDAGLIDLDAPMPELEALPDFPHAGAFTVRQLLDHTAGLSPYQETSGFAAISDDVLTPEAVLELAGDDPLQWEPGSERGYSNSGYLLLGLLAEQASGTSYEDLVAEKIGAVGLSSMSLDTEPRQRWVGWSAGGLVSSVPDLARWGAALYRDGSVLSEEMLAEMTGVDNEFSTGLGAFPTCPCSRGANGEPVFTSIGHDGGQVTVQYSAEDDLVIAVSVTESMWSPFLSTDDVHELVNRVRTAAGP